MKNVGVKKNSFNSKVTPMMAQYLEIKRNNLDYLLFYRMGDFYELFFEDAEKAAAVLDIALTKRGKHLGQDIPMCGVPVNSHQVYLSKLIKSGFKVAICEQTEDPLEARKRGAKSVVSREVVRIITPGTLTEDDLLEHNLNNYLAAIYCSATECSLAWLDLSTGAFLVQTIDVTNVGTVLSRIEPSEILITENSLASCDLFATSGPWKNLFTFVPEITPDKNIAISKFEEFFKNGDTGFLFGLSNTELFSCMILFDYLVITQKGTIRNLQEPVKFQDSNIMLIDDATRKNLELTKTMDGSRVGSFLNNIDFTKTGGGGRKLHNWLSAPLFNTQAIGQRLDSVAFFFGGQKERAFLQQQFREFPDIERAIGRLSMNRGAPRDLARVKNGLVVGKNVRSHIPAVGLPKLIKSALENLDKNEDLIGILTDALLEDLPVLAKDGGFIKTGFSQELDELRAIMSDSQGMINELQQKYANSEEIPNLKIKFNRMLGYFIETTKRHGDILLSNNEVFIHRQTMKNAVRFSTEELISLEGKISTATEKALAIELAIFETIVSKVISKKEKILSTADAVSFLDVICGFAEMAENKNYCRPTVDNSSVYEIKQGRHPVVENSSNFYDNQISGKTAFVSNDCSLTQDDRLWLLTGPNMAGKSTYLRQNALIPILAQMGSFVPAASAHIGLIDKLFSRVGASDNLARGHSTFMVEMVETAAILKQATKKSFVILDEIGRGTATFDGLSIAWAVIEYLHEQNACRGLFATHYHELTEISEQLNSLSCHKMSVKEWRGEVVFLHTVGPGSADRSYGIHVADLAGLPKQVVKRADNLLSIIEKNSPNLGNLKGSKPLPLLEEQTEDSEMERLAEVAKVLRDISPDDLSPKQALEHLYLLKKIES